MWKTGRATSLVLALLAFLTLFLNGVFEEGREPPGYPRVVLRAIELSVLLMPAYAAIALYGTMLRVTQYGLTPERVYALLFIGVASVYAIGYAAAVVLRRSPWIATLKSVNVCAALLVALLAVLVQLPVLDPLRLSAESQASRLREERVEEKDFDFATLRFRLGHHGWEALKRLEAMMSDRYGPDQACRREGDCVILGVDLDRDGSLEYCLLGGSNWWYTACYSHRGARAWERIGSLAYRGPGSRPSREKLEARLAIGPVATRAARYDDLLVPEGVLELVPTNLAQTPD